MLIYVSYLARPNIFVNLNYFKSYICIKDDGWVIQAIFYLINVARVVLNTLEVLNYEYIEYQIL
jgi:hypothetical protein